MLINHTLVLLNIKEMKPEVGQEIYIPSSWYVYRGKDDVKGGKAKIKAIHINDYLPVGHPNRVMVEVEEVPSCRYNWSVLLEEQEELKELYGDKIAHPDPDLNPEFNNENADWV